MSLFLLRMISCSIESIETHDTSKYTILAAPTNGECEMMNGGGWRDRGEPVEWIMVGSEAIDFHAYSISCPPAL